MVSLEQAQVLEAKVGTAVKLITDLLAHNRILSAALEKSQNRMKELESLMSEFSAEQQAIEQVILRSIQNLNYDEQRLSA